ncbi:hypothetical protein [Amycolatopsis sp. MtRt-6]|uniref:hypothetical protein n=1 Tax=Amycolatopsis sp. MtRt-6 TaxID=2792782 RepID=UPI001A8DDD8C|nr:hypothetical protein [Amycolatopsis sp. MtRt-6]
MTEADSISESFGRALQVRFKRIDLWWELFQGKLDTHPNSPLAGDDRDTAPWQVSHAAQSYLLSAVEHLHTIRMLVGKAGVLHPRSTYTLMRSALENAATVLWMLEPSLRNERIVRRLRLRWTDALEREDIVNDMGTVDRSSLTDTRTKILEIADRKGFTGDQRSQVVGRKVSYVSMVKAAAGPDRSITVPGHLTAIWSQLSGIAHGSQRAQIELLQRNVVADGGLGTLEVRLTTSEKEFITILSMTMLVVIDALELFTKKRSNPWAAAA